MMSGCTLALLYVVHRSGGALLNVVGWGATLLEMVVTALLKVVVATSLLDVVLGSGVGWMHVRTVTGGHSHGNLSHLPLVWVNSTRVYERKICLS